MTLTFAFDPVIAQWGPFQLGWHGRSQAARSLIGLDRRQIEWIKQHHVAVLCRQPRGQVSARRSSTNYRDLR